MAKTSRSTIKMFTMRMDHLPESVRDINGNANYVLKEDLMKKWTAILTKTKAGLFALRFNYELEMRVDRPE